MAVQTPSYSKAQREKAEALVARAATWSYGYRTSDGLRFVVFASQSTPGAVYQTHLNGLGCSCPAGQREIRCYHALACEMLTTQKQAQVERQTRNAAAYSRLYGDDLEDAF